MSDAAASVYQIDGSDRIRATNEQWDRFAHENGAPHLEGEAISGRSLWEFVDGQDVRHVYELLLSSAREGRAIRTPFRCDAPDRRRFMELEIRPQFGEALELRAVLVRQEMRPAVKLLDAQAKRGDEILYVCSWCRGIRVEGRWVEVETAVSELDLFGDVMPRLSHGICPECARVVESQLVGHDSDGAETGNETSEVFKV